MKRYKNYLLVLVFISCTVLSCDENDTTSGPEHEHSNSTTIVHDGIEYALSTDRVSYQTGDVVNIAYRVTNTTDTTRLLGTVIIRQELRLHIRNSSHVVWVYDGNPTARPTDIQDMILSPGEYEEFSAQWEITSVSPGAYTVVCRLALLPSNEQEESVPFLSLPIEIQ